MNKLLTPLKLLELTYGKDVSRFNGLDIIIKEVNDVSERWQEFVSKNFIPKPNSKERVKVLTALHNIVDHIPHNNDVKLIKDVNIIIEYLEKQGNNES